MDSVFRSGRLSLSAYLRTPNRFETTATDTENDPADVGVTTALEQSSSSDVVQDDEAAAPASSPFVDDPGVILCHGFPTGPLDARRSAGTYPELVDRIVHQVGLPAMTFNFRGCGNSEGDFSLQGWVDDLRAAIDHLVAETGVGSIILVGTNTGGSIALCAGVDDARVAAAALLGGRADFDDWADHPRRFLQHARQIGAVRSTEFPPSMDEWSREFQRFRPLAAARRFAPRPMLVMHGDDDELVPPSESRQIAEAHGDAELSILEGAGHRLRHDPRAVAVLLGWLSRIR